MPETCLKVASTMFQTLVNLVIVLLKVVSYWIGLANHWGIWYDGWADGVGLFDHRLRYIRRFFRKSQFVWLLHCFCDNHSNYAPKLFLKCVVQFVRKQVQSRQVLQNRRLWVQVLVPLPEKDQHLPVLVFFCLGGHDGLEWLNATPQWGVAANQFKNWFATIL